MSSNPGGGGNKGLPQGPGIPVSAPNQNRVLPTPATNVLPPMAALQAAAVQPNQGAGGSDLASLFECPVCFDYVLPPILQCHAGHLVCSNCRPKPTVMDRGIYGISNTAFPAGRLPGFPSAGASARLSP